MFNKKASDLTVKESLIISGIITVICFLPTCVAFALTWFDGRKKERRDA